MNILEATNQPSTDSRFGRHTKSNINRSKSCCFCNKNQSRIVKACQNTEEHKRKRKPCRVQPWKAPQVRLNAVAKNRRTWQRHQNMLTKELICTKLSSCDHQNLQELRSKTTSPRHKSHGTPPLFSSKSYGKTSR